jgi:oligoendopeptidase F
LSQYPIFLAEIASTFNENLLVRYLLDSESDEIFKLYILDNFLDGLKGTIYRQVLFAEFELEMHTYVEQGNTLTPDWLNDLYLRLTREYYGHDKNVCIVDENIQNEWAVIPHFFYNYYVYQYSTGIISSMALADMVLNGGEEERERYLTFLKAGGSDYPVETLKKAGVDITKPEAIISGLKIFSDSAEEMSRISNQLMDRGKL